jgi:hypothetical protein
VLFFGLLSCFVCSGFIAGFLVAAFAFFFAIAVAISSLVIGMLSDASRETDFFAMFLSLLLKARYFFLPSNDIGEL